MQAAEGVIASQDALIIIFEKIANAFKPLEEYAEVPKIKAVKDIVVKIMVESLEIFAIITTEIKQGQSGGSVPDDMSPMANRGPEMSRKNFFKKLITRKGIEGSLSRLNRLTQNAVKRMKAAGTKEEKRSWLLSLASLVAEI